MLDAGLLVEQLLFYGEVHLQAGPAHLEFLLTRFGPDGVKRLLENKSLHIHYFEEFFAVQSENGLHWPIAARFLGRDGKSRPHDPE